MAQFLYRIQPARLELMTAPTPEELALVGEHFAYLQQLQANGTLILAGRTLEPDEHAFGATIFEAPDEAAAREIMLGDPAVKAGMMTAKLFPFQIVAAGQLPDSQ